MSVRDTHTPNPSGIIARTRQIAIDGGAAGTHTLAEIAVGDFIISVFHQSSAADVLSVEDLTDEFVSPIVTAAEIDNTGGTSSADGTLWVTFYDKDWGALVNAAWVGS